MAYETQGVPIKTAGKVAEPPISQPLTNKKEKVEKESIHEEFKSLKLEKLNLILEEKRNEKMRLADEILDLMDKSQEDSDDFYKLSKKRY